MRKTTIDIGTNTILMLIAEFTPEKSEIKTLLDIQRIPRLGKGVDSSRNILPESIEKAIKILNEYRQISGDYSSESITATATSFIRDSNNKEEFINTIFKNTGIKIEILSGTDEAKWSFIGGIYDKIKTKNKKLKITTIDIGGGSTEITSGHLPEQLLFETLNNIKISGSSIDIGSVRVKEKILKSHPPLDDEMKTAEEFILKQIFQFDGFDKFYKSGKSHLIGIAGTITTLGAIKLRLDRFIAENVDNLELTLNEINHLITMLTSKSLDELFTMGNYMEGRADIIIPGTLILKCFMEKFGFDKLTISTKGLRYGIFMREIYKSKN